MRRSGFKLAHRGTLLTGWLLAALFVVFAILPLIHSFHHFEEASERVEVILVDHHESPAEHQEPQHHHDSDTCDQCVTLFLTKHFGLGPMPVWSVAALVAPGLPFTDSGSQVEIVLHTLPPPSRGPPVMS